MKKTIMLVLIVLAITAFTYYTGTSLVKEKGPGLQTKAMPGDLSAAHANLTSDCASCHTAVKGVEDAKCISCHATNKSLLQRQPTAFHASIGNCASCHKEHLGVNANLRVMNHETLASLGKKITADAKGEKEGKKMAVHGDHPLVSALEASLDCAGCHSTKDKHQGLFGTDCASCHATAQWTIPKFQHPSVLSIDCNQCHQAPPSHYMEHFAMISQKIAAQEKALVTECYQCHQTTSWNDIRGLGYYKHH